MMIVLCGSSSLNVIVKKFVRHIVTDLQHLIYRFRSDGIMKLVNYSLITRRPAWWVGYMAAVQGLPVSVATCKTYH